MLFIESVFVIDVFSQEVNNSNSMSWNWSILHDVVYSDQGYALLDSHEITAFSLKLWSNGLLCLLGK